MIHSVTATDSYGLRVFDKAGQEIARMPAPDKAQITGLIHQLSALLKTKIHD